MNAQQTPPGYPMPTPVPHWDEAAAALSEGFCPACHKTLAVAYRVGTGAQFGTCPGPPCDCTWVYDHLPSVPVITWRGCDGPIYWVIHSFSNGDIHGTAEWSE